jgi:hypothetical protein
VFNPGTAGTLLNDILALLDNKAKSSKLYIHGVANGFGPAEAGVHVLTDVLPITPRDVFPEFPQPAPGLRFSSFLWFCGM